MRDKSNLLKVYVAQQADGWQATCEGATIARGFSTQALLESNLVHVHGFLPQEIEAPDESF